MLPRTSTPERGSMHSIYGAAMVTWLQQLSSLKLSHGSDGLTTSWAIGICWSYRNVNVLYHWRHANWVEDQTFRSMAEKMIAFSSKTRERFHTTRARRTDKNRNRLRNKRNITNFTPTRCPRIFVINHGIYLGAIRLRFLFHCQKQVALCIASFLCIWPYSRVWSQ